MWRIGGQYSAIYKDETWARAVFNLAFANEHCTGAEVPFDLLSSKGFLSLLRSTDFKNKRLNFVHCDIANAYYNFPIGEALGRACCVRVGDKLYESKVANMGFKKNCGTCQALVWGSLLARKPGEDRLCVGEEWTAPEIERALGWIPLEDGGLHSPRLRLDPDRNVTPG